MTTSDQMHCLINSKICSTVLITNILIYHDFLPFDLNGLSRLKKNSLNNYYYSVLSTSLVISFAIK